MQLRAILFIVGALLVCVGATMIIPMAVSIGYEDDALPGVAASLGIVAGGGLVLAWFNRPLAPLRLNPREGLAVVGICWIVASFAGGLPYVLTGWMTVTDAVFEAASGFTTTGATVLGDIEALPRGLLIWRSLTHWLGGMGIIVLSLIVLPLLGVGGMQLYRAEAPGPRPDKITPRLQDTAIALWKIYCLMTLVLIVLLHLAGMDWFDAVNHSFSTVATGGFSTRNASIAAFPSPVIQWILVLFMFFAGVNFVLHYRFLSGDFGIYRRSTEFLAYAGLLAAGGAVIVSVLILGGVFPLHCLADMEQIVRAAMFQLVSICTTTGFVSENYIGWPALSLGVLLLFTFMGASTGSTAGGVKILRMVVLVRLIYEEIFRLLHPRSVRGLKIDGQPVLPEMLSGIVGFFLLYLLVLILGTLLVTAQGTDLMTAFTASLTCISNVGPGLGKVGPVDNFGWMPDFSKWVLSLVMLLGRLEFYAIVVLVVPEFWRR